MAGSWQPDRPVRRLLLGVAGVTLATGLRIVLIPLIGSDVPFLILFPVTVVIGLFLGLASAVVSTIFGVVLTVVAIGALPGQAPPEMDASRLTVLMVGAILAGVFGETLPEARRRAASAESEAAARLKEGNAALERRVAERTAEVEAQAARVKSLAVQLAQTEQRERNRLAKYLHDGVQQLLVAAKFQAGMILRREQDEALKQAARLLEQLLDDSLQASRSLISDLSPLALYDRGLVPGLEWLVRWMEQKQGFTIVPDLDPAAEPADETVRFTLFEATRELLLNVVKHAEVTEARLAACRTPEGRISVTVSDDGKGFDPGRAGSPGSGFGLLAVRQRLEFLGGDLSVESIAGRGTRVTVTAPAGPVTRHGEAGPPVAPAGPGAVPPEPGGIRVLLVDDHKMVRQGLAAMLLFEPGIVVVGEAGDGREALEAAARLRPDVVVMDVSMPVMDGVEATRLLRAEQPDARVIGLSLHESEDMARAMMTAGAVDYLTKGGPADVLAQRIRAAAPRPAA